MKTIKKFLGNNYEVIASNGHVRDLPKSSMGIDVDNNFEHKYTNKRLLLYMEKYLLLNSARLPSANHLAFCTT